MEGWDADFVEYFVGTGADSGSEATAGLKGTLVRVWEMFQEEFERVSLEELDGRYIGTLTILP
jgi:hypothetical protein